MDLKKLISDLNGPVEADRLYAAEDLAEANDAGAVAALTGRLSVEPSRAVKEAIFLALERIHDDSVLSGVIDLIDANDAFVRNEAVHLLSKRGAPAMPALVQAIGSEDCDVRKFALDAMAKIDSLVKDEIYPMVLDDPDINIVITAVEYIGRDKRTALRERVEQVLEQATHPMLIAACVESLGQIGNSGSLQVMYRKLGGEEMAEFQAPGFVRALGYLGVDDHVDLLCRLIERFPATLVDTGLDAIESIRCRVSLPQAQAALLAAVRSIVMHCSIPLGRYKAVQALGAFTDEGARELVRQFLESPDKMARLAAVESIAHWDAAEAKKILACREHIETDMDVLAAIQDSLNK